MNFKDMSGVLSNVNPYFGVTSVNYDMGDFLIGAHALVHADCLLSRDLGVYKSNFRDLKIVSSA